MVRRLLTVLLTAAISAPVLAEDRFADLVGNVSVGDVQWDGKSPLRMPIITWGGESGTFQANGLSLQTKPDSTYGKLGVNVELVKGDDFVQQVRDYIAGKSPFLRGTYRMIGMASEAIGSNPKTQGVVFMQLTWSLGDHIVARKHIKTITDLKGTTGIIQTGGPHVGLVHDALKTANLGWDDLKSVIWVEDLTGPKGPAEAFRKNPSADWCTVITPDMIGLTGGLQNVGSGAEGTVEGARVVVSTSELSRSIADVYVCRKDFFNAHRDLMHKIVAGYLSGCNRVVALKKDYESKGSKDYEKLLRFMQQTFGEDVLPTIEEDAHGLILDMQFVGPAGNVAFLTEENNPNGFNAFLENSLELATSRGYASKREPMLAAALDYDRIAKLGGLGTITVARKERFNAEAVQQEIESFTAGNLDDRTIYSFTINFEPNQLMFPIRQYEKEFSEVIKLASKYGNAVIAVRGHSDLTKTLIELVKAGKAKGVLQQSGSKQAGYKYTLNGRPFTLDRTEEVMQMISNGAFDGVDAHNPRETMQAALNLSMRRAENVRDSIIKHADHARQFLDKTQIQPQGVGIREPFVSKPRNYDEALQNMRVEFRLIRVDAEVIRGSDDAFDF